MNESTHHPILPQGVRAVGGFIGQRFNANLNGRLKDIQLSEEFITRNERKNYDDWFWTGEQIGKWLEAAAYAGLITRDQALLARVHELVERLARSQEPDGYVGVTAAFHRNPVRGMQLYEWYYVLLGLLEVATLLKEDAALQIALRLGDFIIRTWGPASGQFPLVGRFPGNGHDGGEGSLILEPIVRLGQLSGQARFIDWGEQVLAKWDDWFEAHPESIHTCGYTMMKRFAAGEVDVFETRDNLHAHTFHMTLLGLAALYEATGKPEYRAVVLGCVDRLAKDWIFLTGGMSSGERYIPRRFYHPNGEIEVCPQHTWILLLEQAYRWTGEPSYLAEIERDLFNQFLAAQLADGSNWSYMTPLNGHAQEPFTPNCCNAAGHRIAARMPTYLYGLRQNQPAVLMFSASEAVIEAPGLPPVRLCQQTNFPTSGSVILRVDPDREAQFTLHVRIPPYAAGARLRVNGGEWAAALEGQFALVERFWQPGDVLELDLPFRITCQANQHEVALVRGPLVYAYFQNAQAHHENYYWHRSGYPEDVELILDPHSPEDAVRVEPAPDGLLGPALRVKGRISARAPMFSTAEGNDQLGGEKRIDLILLPFAEQGAVRGDYRVFNRFALQ